MYVIIEEESISVDDEEVNDCGDPSVARESGGLKGLEGLLELFGA